MRSTNVKNPTTVSGIMCSSNALHAGYLSPTTFPSLSYLILAQHAAMKACLGKSAYQKISIRHLKE